jgi:tetratricopeptide (TPR) repeat protein
VDIEGIAPLELDVMTEQEALELLQSLIGVERTQAEPDAAKTIIDLCSRLPLALRITGGTLRNQPEWRLEDCAVQLTDERQRLLSLRLSDLAVRVSLALSYQQLDANAARLFRLLGLLTGPNFTPALATALLESEPATAQEAVKQLVDVQLLEPASERRDRFHDLVRLFARGQLAQEEPSEARQAARLRISRWYLDNSQIIDLALDSETRRQLAQVLREGKNQSVQITEQNLFLAGLNWFESERTNLMASIRWAHQAQEWEIVTSLAKNLVNFFYTYADWTDWEQTHLLALETTRILKDLSDSYSPSNNIAERDAEAQTLMNLANLYALQNDWLKASDCYEESLRIFRQLGERLGIAKTLGNLANIYSQQGDWGKASDYYQQSLNIFGELKDNYGEGQTLANLGILAAQQNNEEKAVGLWQEALGKLPSNLPKSEQISEWLQSTRQLPVEVYQAPIKLHQHQGSTIKIVGGVIVVIAIALLLIFIIF